MNFVEHVAKQHLLVPAGVAVPKGRLADSPAAAAEAFAEIGPCVIKAQVPTGKRGKAGGIKAADSAEAAADAARTILGMSIAGHLVDKLLVEERAEIEREFYAAVLPDTASRSPLVLFSSRGGMDVEEIAAEAPDTFRRRPVAPGERFGAAEARDMLKGLDLGGSEAEVADILTRLHRIFVESDAELVEINPLARLADGRVVALDAKFTLDDAAAFRQPDLAAVAAVENPTDLERRGAEVGLKFIQLDGNVGVLANGAGLTMTTMDVISHFGGRPANFMEIGGEAYTKSETALELVLSNPGVKSLVINFCGAFARTDVMAEGVVKAWQALKPTVPVFFSIHGTGEEEAIALVRGELGIEPYDLMEDAVKAAVEAAR
ncbi:ATP-grasp domain-containing protein [Rhodospirillaceae bacterium SYSU D60014]|uniref:succinate--CoA ligase subunit beta n=1 Tax=Virgifigura deserti TaxID=2268457 RepID=UPI000E65FAB6